MKNNSSSLVSSETRPQSLSLRITQNTIRFFVLVAIVLTTMTAWAKDDDRLGPKPQGEHRVSRQKRAAEDRARRMTELRERAKRQGLPVSGLLPNGGDYTLSGFDEAGRPQYYSTLMGSLAITQRTDLVRKQAAFGSPSGQGLVVGMWDSGLPRLTHEQLKGKVASADGTTYVTSHSALVAGILAARATATRPDGMAPDALVASYSYDGDLDEMAAAGRRASAQTSGLLVSNHSYQRAGLGWTRMVWAGLVQPLWQGPWGIGHDSRFGTYSEASRRIDIITSEAPYYLPIWSAGNDRSTSTNTNAAPLAGQRFYYFDPILGTLSAAEYDPAVHPAPDDKYHSGYDTMIPDALAKNVVAVGSVQDAVRSGARDLSLATISSFSSWGPADDGRVKPDLVSNGNTVSGPYHSSDTSYQSASGTSFSAPGVAGAATLLQDLYSQKSGGTYMRAATLKALMLHTAEDLGNPGPDYIFGWGLMDTKRAADLILDHSAAPVDGNTIVEARLVQGTDGFQIPVQVTSGALRVTLSWTDLPGRVRESHNDRTPNLVNDLDLRLSGPSGAFLPFVLDPENPSLPAETGDNLVDNVEQIVAGDLANGLYTISVEHKGTLEAGEQAFSLIVTGHDAPSMGLTPESGLVARGEQGSGYFGSGAQVMTLTNLRGGSLTWSTIDAAPWVVIAPDHGVLADVNSSEEVVVAIDPEAASGLAPGCYTTPITFVDEERGTEFTRTVTLEVEGAQSLPATESFEKGRLGFAWTTSDSTGATAGVSTFLDGPCGAYGILFQDTVQDGIDVMASADWRVKTEGSDRLWLTYWGRGSSTGIDNYPPDYEPYATASFDGLSVSVNGIDWFPLLRHIDSDADWMPYSLDLSAALEAKGLADASEVTLRFMWTGDGDTANEGFGLDRLRIESIPVPARFTGLMHDQDTEQYLGVDMCGTRSVWMIGEPGAPAPSQLVWCPLPGRGFIAIEETTGDIVTIDPNDGARTVVSNYTLPEETVVTGASWDKSLGQLAVLSAGPEGSKFQAIALDGGRTGLPLYFHNYYWLEGLAATADGSSFYTIDLGTGELLMVDRKLSRMLPVGMLGVQLRSGSVSLSLDDETGTLYLTARASGKKYYSIWRLDLTTGAAREEFAFSADLKVSAFAFQSETPEGVSLVEAFDTTMEESDAGTQEVSVTLSVSPAATADITVAYSVEGDTAAVTFDFPYQHGTVTIPAGATFVEVPIGITGDSIHEADERLSVRFTMQTSQAELVRHQATVTIVDNDPLPKYAGQSIGAQGTLYLSELHKPEQTLEPVATLEGVTIAGGDTRGDDSNTLYAWDQTGNRLLSIDMADGATTVLGYSTPLDGGQWTGLSWDVITNRFYALSTSGSGSRVYSVSLSPFAVTSLGSSKQTNCLRGAALAADPATGRLWAFDRALNRLVHFDKTTGECFIGASLACHLSGSESIDADFQAITGDLYLAAWNGETLQSELLLVDVATGRTECIGTLGDGSTPQAAFATTGIQVPVTLSMFLLE